MRIMHAYVRFIYVLSFWVFFCVFMLAQQASTPQQSVEVPAPSTPQQAVTYSADEIANRRARSRAIFEDWLNDHWTTLLEAQNIDDCCALVICHYYACVLCMRIMRV